MLTEINLARGVLSSSVTVFSAVKLVTLSSIVLSSVHNLKRGKTESYQREIKISV